MIIKRGLIIKRFWLEKILNGNKTWEIRGSNTKIRGPIALIQSGSGKIFGFVNVMDSIKLDEKRFNFNINKHSIENIDFKSITYKNKFAWVLKDPIKLKEPIPYEHPMGAIVWVKLEKLRLEYY